MGTRSVLFIDAGYLSPVFLCPFAGIAQQIPQAEKAKEELLAVIAAHPVIVVIALDR
jgi:hypothetical protein